MLAKKYRITRANLIKKQIGSRKSIFFTIKIFSSPLPYSRYAVVVNKKVSPRATERNRVKRIVLMYVQKNKLFKNPNEDVIVIVLPSARGVIRDKLIKALQEVPW